MTHDTYPLCSELAFKNAQGDTEIYELHDRKALHEVPSEYVTEDELNTILNSYYTKTEIHETFYTKDETENRLHAIDCELIETYDESNVRVTVSHRMIYE